MTTPSNQDNGLTFEIIGTIAGLISCTIFLIYHHIAISNIWFSAPFLYVISAIAGFLLFKSYLTLNEEYMTRTWFLFILYYIVMLGILCLISILIFDPKIASDEILNSTGGAPEELILGAMPLNIVWMVISTIGLMLIHHKSLIDFPKILGSFAVIFLTLGLNVSIFGFVEASPEHTYLYFKFWSMIVMLGVFYMISFDVISKLYSRWFDKY